MTDQKVTEAWARNLKEEEGSYFARCERDEQGRCLPEGGSPEAQEPAQTAQPAKPANKSRLTSVGKMSNTGYHQNNKPTWWARIGSGTDAKFLSLPRVRGDDILDVDVDVPPGTTVYIGSGRGSYKTYRATVVTK